MRPSVPTAILTAIFALVTAGDVQEATAKHGRNHETLGKTGVLIPITNPRKLNNGHLQFDVHATGINKLHYAWSKLWGKDFGYYLEGTSTDENRQCPYFKKQDMTYFDKETVEALSHYRITLGLPKHMLNDLTEAECAISRDPGDKIAPNLNSNDTEPDARGPKPSAPTHRP